MVTSMRTLVARISQHALHRGVSAPGGLPLEGCALGGACSRGGVSQHVLRQTTPCEQNHRHM